MNTQKLSSHTSLVPNSRTSVIVDQKDADSFDITIKENSAKDKDSLSSPHLLPPHQPHYSINNNTHFLANEFSFNSKTPSTCSPPPSQANILSVQMNTPEDYNPYTDDSKLIQYPPANMSTFSPQSNSTITNSQHPSDSTTTSTHVTPSKHKRRKSSSATPLTLSHQSLIQPIQTIQTRNSMPSPCLESKTVSTSSKSTQFGGETKLSRLASPIKSTLPPSTLQLFAKLPNTMLASATKHLQSQLHPSTQITLPSHLSGTLTHPTQQLATFIIDHLQSQQTQLTSITTSLSTLRDTVWAGGLVLQKQQSQIGSLNSLILDHEDNIDCLTNNVSQLQSDMIKQEARLRTELIYQQQQQYQHQKTLLAQQRQTKLDNIFDLIILAISMLLTGAGPMFYVNSTLSSVSISLFHLILRYVLQRNPYTFQSVHNSFSPPSSSLQTPPTPSLSFPHDPRSQIDIIQGYPQLQTTISPITMLQPQPQQFQHSAYYTSSHLPNPSSIPSTSSSSSSSSSQPLPNTFLPQQIELSPVQRLRKRSFRKSVFFSLLRTTETVYLFLFFRAILSKYGFIQSSLAEYLRVLLPPAMYDLVMRLFGQKSRTKSKHGQNTQDDQYTSTSTSSFSFSSGPLFYRLPTYIQQVLRQIIFIIFPFFEFPPPPSAASAPSASDFSSGSATTPTSTSNSNAATNIHAFDGMGMKSYGNDNDDGIEIDLASMSKDEIYKRVFYNVSTNPALVSSSLPSSVASHDTVGMHTHHQTNDPCNTSVHVPTQQQQSQPQSQSWYQSYVQPFTSTVIAAAFNPFSTSLTSASASSSATLSSSSSLYPSSIIQSTIDHPPYDRTTIALLRPVSTSIVGMKTGSPAIHSTRIISTQNHTDIDASAPTEHSIALAQHPNLASSSVISNKTTDLSTDSVAVNKTSMIPTTSTASTNAITATSTMDDDTKMTATTTTTTPTALNVPSLNPSSIFAGITKMFDEIFFD